MENEQALALDTVHREDLLFVRLRGVIDENNRLAERLPAISNAKVLVNLSGIERINSCGVRDWVRWIQALERQGNRLYFLQCSPVVIGNMNLVRNFCGSQGQVVSFQAPYHCATCDKDHQESMTLNGSGPIDAAPHAACPTCGEPLEFDDLPATYFDFTRQHGTLPVDPFVQSALQQFANAHLVTKVALLKELSSGTVTPAMTGQTSAPRIETEGGAASTAPSAGRAATEPLDDDAPTRRLGAGLDDPPKS